MEDSLLGYTSPPESHSSTVPVVPISQVAASGLVPSSQEELPGLVPDEHPPVAEDPVVSHAPSAEEPVGLQSAPTDEILLRNINFGTLYSNKSSILSVSFIIVKFLLVLLSILPKLYAINKCCQARVLQNKLKF